MTRLIPQSQIEELLQTVCTYIQNKRNIEGSNLLSNRIQKKLSPQDRKSYLYLILMSTSFKKFDDSSILPILFKKFASVVSEDEITYESFGRMIAGTLKGETWKEILLESAKVYFEHIPKSERTTLTNEETNLLTEMMNILENKGTDAISNEMIDSNAITEATRIKSQAEVKKARIKKQKELQKEKMRIAERLKVAGEAHGFEIDDTTAKLLLGQGIKSEQALIKTAKAQQLQKLRNQTSELFKVAAKQYQRGDLRAIENYSRYLSGKFVREKVGTKEYPPHELRISQIPAQDIIEVLVADVNNDHRAEVIAVYNLRDSLLLSLMNGGGQRIYQKEKTSRVGSVTLEHAIFSCSNVDLNGFVLFLKDKRYDEGTMECVDLSSDPCKSFEVHQGYSNRLCLSAVTTGDVTGNGTSELIVGTASGYSGSVGGGIGLSIWDLAMKREKLQASERAFTLSGEIQQIATGDIDGDGREEIFTLEGNNTVRAYKMRHGELTFVNLQRARKANQIFVRDNSAIVVNKPDHRLWLIKGGKQIEENDLFHARDVFPEAIALPDINGDGRWEFVGITEDHCYLSTNSPTDEWMAYKKGLNKIMRTPYTVWGDMDQDGSEEVLIHTGDKLHLLDYIPKLV